MESINRKRTEARGTPFRHSRMANKSTSNPTQSTGPLATILGIGAVCMHARSHSSYSRHLPSSQENMQSCYHAQYHVATMLNTRFHPLPLLHKLPKARQPHIHARALPSTCKAPPIPPPHPLPAISELPCRQAGMPALDRKNLKPDLESPVISHHLIHPLSSHADPLALADRHQGP